eukprot:8058985-Pyramimonas_sp.AAC.1
MPLIPHPSLGRACLPTGGFWRKKMKNSQNTFKTEAQARLQSILIRPLPLLDHVHQLAHCRSLPERSEWARDVHRRSSVRPRLLPDTISR